MEGGEELGALALDGQPVVAITGHHYHDLIDTHSQQDVDLDRLYMDVACYNARVMGAAHVASVTHLACRTALERGLGILVEKPFTQDLAEAIELVDRAEAAGVPLLVAQSYRRLRVHRAAREVVRSGRLGEVRQVICQHYRIEPEPAIQGEHSTLWDLGAHHLDAIRDLVDDEPVAILASSFDEGLSAQVLLEFQNGARATYHATRRSSGHRFFERGKEHYLRAVGDRGTLHVLHRWLLLFESGRAPRLRWFGGVAR